MPALLSQAKRVREQVQVARQLIDRITVIDDIPRQYVAELIIVRIFALFESIVEDSACLMVCGAPYCDDQRPNLLRPTPTRGRVRALSAMRDYGRSDPRCLAVGVTPPLVKIARQGAKGASWDVASG